MFCPILTLLLNEGDWDYLYQIHSNQSSNRIEIVLSNGKPAIEPPTPKGETDDFVGDDELNK